MKAMVKINGDAGPQFAAEFPHDVCIDEEIVFNGVRWVIIDIYLENIRMRPPAMTTAGTFDASADSSFTPDPVIFRHVVICEPAGDGE